MTGNKRHRLEKQGIGSGRKKKAKPIRENRHLALGGVPMKVSNGKIEYAWKFLRKSWTYSDQEEIERDNAILPEGDGDFVRRHIYEVRFDIHNETDDERRKREYKEWWDKNDHN
jgi:hypothetical protein